jgi:uncharacterized protein YhjY with autotransporter beta-barrel domain
MTQSSAKAHSRAWKLAASMLALTLGAGLSSTASAQTAPEGMWSAPDIVGNDNLNPNAGPPTGTWDNIQNITGIGQMTIRGNPATTGMNLCTGTLINPRTVIFAAHCVNTRPADAYGAVNGTPFGAWTAGGTPIAFGFEFDNLPAVRQWLGLASVPGGTDANPALLHATNAARHLYSVEHVWYDPRSLAPSSIGFLEADIAIATLDTPATDIPTWVMLFTPLDGETHAVVTGYGGNGTSASVQAGPLPSGNTPIDWRRRAAENMISFLGSLDDVDDWLFGPAGAINPQTLYQLDFDSPAGEGAYTGTAPDYDFDIFQGTALPNEAITAGGDSGGPLIADQYFDTPVMVATLSGGSRFHNNQRFATYGTTSFYQPLFMYWQEIVANNPYVYAGNRNGNRSWTDPNHWVQQMDPAYGIELNGALANGLPGVGSYGVSGATPKFGEVCFLTDCTNNAVDPEAVAYNVGTPNSIHVPGGPGSTNFVPNNVVANPSLGIRPRYYDVTLDGHGVTWLSSAVTIDRFTMDGGLTALDVRSGGTLNVLGDFTVLRGGLDLDGRINSGEAVFVQGLLTGGGTFNPTYFTAVDSIIAPGDLFGIGTLSIQGDVVLASGNELLIELGRSTNDRLRVLADAAQGTTGIASLGGDVWFSPSGAGGGPRHNNSYTFVTADGGVVNTFDSVNGYLGILRPQVTYGANTVTVKLKAGSFWDALLHNEALMPLALALDEIREDHYASLYGLYGEIDLMNPAQLAGAFSALTPSSMMDARGLMAMQDNGFSTTLQNRLALIARSQEGPVGLTMMGAPSDVFAFNGNAGLNAAGDLAFASEFAQSRKVMDMPNGMTGFFSGGYDESLVSPVSGRTALSTDDAMRTWSMAGGVEQHFGAFTLGVAASYSQGRALQTTTSASAENDIAQSALYGVYRFDDGVYVSGLVGVGTSRTTTERRFMAGALDYHMQGETNGSITLASLEGGVNFDLARGLVLTPRISVQHTETRIDGFTEAGGGETALAFDEQAYERFEARLGVSLAGDFSVGAGWRFAPNIDVSAVSNLARDGDGVWARFVAVDDVPFYLPGEARDDLWAEVTAGLSFSRDETSIALRLEQSIERQELHDDRVVARFAQRF